MKYIQRPKSNKLNYSISHWNKKKSTNNIFSIKCLEFNIQRLKNQIRRYFEIESSWVN